MWLYLLKKISFIAGLPSVLWRLSTVWLCLSWCVLVWPTSSSWSARTSRPMSSYTHIGWAWPGVVFMPGTTPTTRASWGTGWSFGSCPHGLQIQGFHNVMMSEIYIVSIRLSDWFCDVKCSSNTFVSGQQSACSSRFWDFGCKKLHTIFVLMFWI